MGALPATEAFYRAGDVSVRVACDSPSLLASLRSYLALPEGENAGPPHINLNLREADGEAIDDLIPLPPREYLFNEHTLLVGSRVPCRIFRKDGKRWGDFAGFGRSFADYESGVGESAVIRRSGIPRVYADILFGYNQLLGLLTKFGYMSVHGSCAEIAGRGVLFTGKSGSGKSTAAGALLSRGCPVLADDRIMLKKKGAAFSALSISDVVKLSSDNIGPFFPELASLSPLHRVNNEIYLKITSTENLRFKNTSEISSVMVFERTGAPRTAAERISPSKVVGDIFPVTMSGYLPEATSEKFNFLMDLLGSVSCYRIHFGTDMEHFACCVNELMAKGEL